MEFPKYFYLKDLKLNLDNDYLELNRIQKTTYIEILEKYYSEYAEIYRKFLFINFCLRK
ncbi:hypothetical protein J2T04_003781 [Chryseobacterium lathyri]|uniref:Uncharacterized protein n=1 Tax=Chryseobacterium lathyri TaxID=395933 RepID=A0ABT9SR01_9FLAO|nr:hypothetical protein [Chryseobacterium lathyri]